MSASRITIDLTGADTSIRYRTHAPRSCTRTRHGYVIDEFIDNDDEDSDESLRALQIVRAQLQRDRLRRRQHVAEYERLAKRQRTERMAQCLPTEEEDNESFSINGNDSDSDASYKLDSDGE